VRESLLAYVWRRRSDARSDLREVVADASSKDIFKSANVEMVVKVLNACSSFSKYWVFAGGLTNVLVRITVIDTQNGTVQTYVNPIETAFQPILDTSAFACP
jgi:hypothetical protein